MGHRKENDVRYEACVCRAAEALEKYAKSEGVGDADMVFHGDFYDIKRDGSYTLTADVREDIRNLEKDVARLELLIDENIVDEEIEVNAEDVNINTLINLIKNFVDALGGVDKVNELEDRIARCYFGMSREELIARIKEESGIELF